MTEYIAFLRAINVGGHTVKMDTLRRLFEELDLAQVTTFIASGNVIFQTDNPPGDERTLECRIEQHLRQALGYEVATFLRTPGQLAAVASYQPFASITLEDQTHTLFVSFLLEQPAPEAHTRLLTLCNDVDDFQVYGREAYWLRRNTAGPSKFTGAALEKALRLPATMRNMTTVRKLARLYPTGSPL